MDIDARSEALVKAPLGCAFLLIAAGLRLPPELASEPGISLHIAARAVAELSVWRPGHAAVVRDVLQRGPQYKWLARSILEQPGAAWWFGPLDRVEQIWVSRAGEPPDMQRLVSPTGPPSKWERYAQKSACGLYTSTRIAGTTSIFAAVREGAGDLTLALPAALWRLEVSQEARVFEIDSPFAWHTLCAQYQAAGEDGRLVPDWSKVAGEWDAVHLSFGGLLTADRVRVESPAGWSEHWGWDAEQTLWLRWVFKRAEQLADFDGFFESAPLPWTPGLLGNHPPMEGVQIPRGRPVYPRSCELGRSFGSRSRPQAQAAAAGARLLGLDDQQLGSSSRSGRQPVSRRLDGHRAR